MDYPEVVLVKLIKKTLFERPGYVNFFFFLVFFLGEVFEESKIFGSVSCFQWVFEQKLYKPRGGPDNQ